MIRENSPLAVSEGRKRWVDYRTDGGAAKMALLPSAWPTVDEVSHVRVVAWGGYADRRVRLSTVVRDEPLAELDPEGADLLAPARGILLGLVIGATFWIAIACWVVL